MQIKTTMRYHCILIRKTKMKDTDHTKCWWRYGASGVLIHFRWRSKRVQSSLKWIPPFLLSVYTFIQFLKQTLMVRPNHCTTRELPERHRSGCLSKKLYMNVHNVFICNSPKLKTIQCPWAGIWINRLWYIHVKNTTQQ